MARNKKNKGVVKGAPSGLAISLLIHAAAFLLAGTLIVFTVASKTEKKFVPPKPVDRPKMKLKKPKVKVKKTSKPKSTTRIVTKVKRASMPDIQLPEMSGIGDGLTGQVGGFEMLPDLTEISAFGSGQTIGNDLVGTFYDLKRSRSGRGIAFSRDNFAEELRDFTRKGFKPSEFARYYRSPKKLYTTTIMVPPMLSCMGPMAYGEPDVPGTLFLIHYTGTISYPEDITFRFWGGSGDILTIGINGEAVLNASWWSAEALYCPMLIGNCADHRKHMLGFQPSAVGDWITLKANEPYKFDAIMGEDPGGGFSAELLVEVKGVEYERNTRGAPILPIFKTAKLTLDQMDAIYKDLVEGEASLTTGPIFNDYSQRNTGDETASMEPDLPEPAQPETPAEPPPLPKEKMRTWTLNNGKLIEAEYITVIGDQVVLKDARNRQKKVPANQFNEADRTYISLESPPDFEFDFAKKTYTRPPIDPGTIIDWIPPTLIDYEFTAKIKQTTARSYEHELQVEFFAFGEEIDGDNYLLLDRQTSHFIPNIGNSRSHSFTGNKVLINDYNDYHNNRRGEKYGGYLITLTDPRGEIIAHGTSHNWLMDIRENLLNLPVGKHFDKSGTRVFPPRPKRQY